MRKHLATLVASAAILAMASVASAEEANLADTDAPILLTAAQMDSVTAGVASVSALARGNVRVTGNFLLDNLPGVFAVATISANITPFAPNAFVRLTASTSLP